MIDYEKAAELLIEKVDKLQAELEKHRWIPVSERLPENPPNDFVNIHILELGYKPHGGYLEGYRQDGTPRFKTSEMVTVNNVTHWKPIVLP